MPRRSTAFAILGRMLLVIPLLGFLPQITQSTLQESEPLPLRLDALTFVFALSLCFSVAISPAQRWRDVLQALAALGLIGGGLLVEHLMALPVALIGVAVMLRSWRWLTAAVLLLIAAIVLVVAGTTTWVDPTTATLTVPVFLLMLATVYVGLDGYPISLIPEPFDPLRLLLQPIWLLPLVRTIAWGPWSSGWALATLWLGAATALYSSVYALWTANPDDRIRHIAATWLGMALGCVGLLTTVGAVSALWRALTYSLSLALLLRSSRWSWFAAPVPFTASFVACWLAQGATAASGAFLLAGAFWFATAISGLAIFRRQEAGGKRQEAATHDTQHAIHNMQYAPLALLSLLLGLLAPLPIRSLIVPAVDLLQGGLTPFGLINIWPWIGLAALDAGQRRVAVLPSIAVFVLTIVIAALIWLVARLLGWWRPTDGSDQATADAWWDKVRQRVWWAGARRRG